MCPQRRPVQRSRETLTCAPGERRGGAGGGAEPEAAHLAAQVSPARAHGGAKHGGTGVERPPRLRLGGGGSRGRFLGRHPPTSGVRGEGRGAARAGARAERESGGRGTPSPSGLRWLGAGAVLARGGRVGRGRGAVHTRRKGVRAGEGLRLPSGGGPCSWRGWCSPRGHCCGRSCADPRGSAGVWFSLASGVGAPGCRRRELSLWGRK